MVIFKNTIFNNLYEIVAITMYMNEFMNVGFTPDNFSQDFAFLNTFWQAMNCQQEIKNRTVCTQLKTLNIFKEWNKGIYISS